MTDDDDDDLHPSSRNFRTAEDERLDALATSISDFLDGELIADVARVCAGLAAAAVAMEYSTTERRHRNLEKLIGFMRRTLQNIEGTMQ